MTGVALAADYTMRANDSAAWVAANHPEFGRLPDIVADFNRSFNEEHAGMMVSGQIESMSANLQEGMAAALAQFQSSGVERMQVADVAEPGSQMGTSRSGPELGV
jgi:hypothetical protein